MVRYHDKILNMTFKLPEFNNMSPDDLYSEHKEEIFTLMYNAIQVLIEKKIPHIPCMSVDGYVFSIHRDSIGDNIDNSIEFFVSTEEYEKCAALLKLKNQILDEVKLNKTT